MHRLVALLVAAAAASAIARPPGTTAISQRHAAPAPLDRANERTAQLPPQDYFGQILPRFLLPLPHYMAFDESRRIPSRPDDWRLGKELAHYKAIEEQLNILTSPYKVSLNRWGPREMYSRPFYDSPVYVEEDVEYDDYQPLENKKVELTTSKPNQEVKRKSIETTPKPNYNKKTAFALSPLDKEYYETTSAHKDLPLIIPETPQREGDRQGPAMLFEPPRQIRQNPNLNKQKNLLGPELGKLKIGLANNNYRIPVSLLPSNLRWLKISNHSNDDQSSHEGDGSLGDSTDLPRHIHMLDTASDPAESIYGIALIAAIGAALTMALFGVAVGWYTLNKKAKAAAEVDYPAYGVTGPTIDSSGDRKLAHSAHMYHYQHQKQQIIAMERNGLEQRTGSVSDPESEEENEEGDYTVYECPGFATTGDMEVKNPLFSEEPTPATPGKCEVVKPQPKD